MSCIARNCGNKHVDNLPGITFHRFPSNTKMSQQWLKLLGLGEYYKIKKNSEKVCSKHFRDEDFQEKTFKDNITRKCLKSNVLPQENLTLNRALESTTSSDSAPKKRRLMNKRGNIKTVCKKDNQKIKNLSKKVCIQKRKIESLKSLLTELQKRTLLDQYTMDVLENIASPIKNFFDFLIKKTEGQRIPRAYQPIIRQFCLTLDFLSPKAYKYVRRVFQDTLPNPSTLASWYRTVAADPGFTEECMDVLRKFVEKEKDQDREVHCQLLFDEIYIFSQIQKVGTKVYGYSSISTHGKTLCEQATQILQFMVVEINGSWKIPIGYFPIHSMTREAKQNLVERAIRNVESIGVSIIGITFDGAPVNMSIMKLMGAKIDLEDPSFCVKIKIDEENESSPEKSYFIYPDPVRNIKLVRNIFGEKLIFYDADDEIIDFKFIIELLNLQEESDFSHLTKFSNTHVYFKNKKMNVKLAVQLLSRSVADCLDYFRDDLALPQFTGSEGTSKFIRKMNNIFDLLSSTKTSNEEFKTPISQDNLDRITAFCENAKMYIANLHFKTIYQVIKRTKQDERVKMTTEEVISKEKLVDSSLKTGFLGLYFALHNVPKIFQKVQRSVKMTGLPTYFLNQDAIDLFFNSIRTQLGSNTRPTVLQYRAAYKKLLTYVQLKESDTGNCVLGVDEIKILQVSPKRCLQQINKISEELSEEENGEQFSNDTEFENIIKSKSGCEEMSLDEDVYNQISSSQFECEYLSSIDEIQKSIVNSIASQLIVKLEEKIKCIECFMELIEEAEDMKEVKFSKHPSALTIAICELSEKLFRSQLNDHGIHKIHEENLENTIISRVITELKVPFGQHFDLEVAHKNYLIELISSLFLRTRIFHQLRKINDKDSIRQ